jgi:thiol:disulfide interchange protein DsbC
MNFLKVTCSILLCCIAAAAGAAEKDDVLRLVAQKMPQLKIREITKLPYGNLYEVVANGYDVYYVDAQAEVLIVGPMVVLDSKRNLTDERKQSLLHVDWQQLPLDKAIVRVKGDGSRKLVLFSDPDCPYCQQLERELQGITNVTIYTLLFPVKELHPDAERKSRLIWCAKDRQEAWDAVVLYGKQPGAADECKTPLEDIAKTAEKMWINVTPGLVFSDGRLVPGTIPRAQIEKFLQAAGNI